MDNNNFPNNPNLNQNNNQQPQQPFTPNGQPQQPFNAAPQQPFNPNPQQNNNPFGGQHQNQPIGAKINNFISGKDYGAHTKGIISTICGAGSVLICLISMIIFSSCVSCGIGNLSKLADNITASYIVCGVLIFIALGASLVGVITAAMGAKNSGDPLLNAGLIISIVGVVLALVLFVACISTCSCSSCATCAANSASSSYSSLLNSLY